MNPDPLIGVFFHWIGGLSSASFYVPYRRIRGWSWEVFWLAGGIFSWVVAPWAFALVKTNDLVGVLSTTAGSTLFWCWFWGAMWGLGGLTFGLTLRYLGLSLGMAVALGLTTIIGTLGPPVFHGTAWQIAATSTGRLTIAGILITLLGILVVAAAGRDKEREAKDVQAAAPTSEFNLRKGLVIALFSGILSGCFAWGLDAGRPIRVATLAVGTDLMSQGLPVLCVVLAGGFTTNLIWCAYLMLRNRSGAQFLGVIDGEPVAARALLRNYLLAACGGMLWYLQFFFYTMGESQMGRYAFSSWTLHMASIILFSTLWGFWLGEWRDCSRKTRLRVWMGIALLVGSTVIIGAGSYIASAV